MEPELCMGLHFAKTIISIHKRFFLFLNLDSDSVAHLSHSTSLFGQKFRRQTSVLNDIQYLMIFKSTNYVFIFLFLNTGVKDGNPDNDFNGRTGAAVEPVPITDSEIYNHITETCK